MSKLPLLNARELAKILENLGFQMKRQEGSHMFFEHKDGRTTVIPNHGGEDIDRGLLNKIIKHDLKMEREKFMKNIFISRTKVRSFWLISLTNSKDWIKFFIFYRHRWQRKIILSNNPLKLFQCYSFINKQHV